MGEYLDKNVENYLKLTGGTRAKMRHADTPFIDEARLPLGCEGDDTESALAKAKVTAKKKKSKRKTRLTQEICSAKAGGDPKGLLI